MKFGQWKEIQETLGASLSSLSSLSETFLRSKKNCHAPLSSIEQNEENTTNNAVDTPFPSPTIPLQETGVPKVNTDLSDNLPEDDPKEIKNGIGSLSLKHRISLIQKLLATCDQHRPESLNIVKVKVSQENLNVPQYGSVCGNRDEYASENHKHGPLPHPGPTPCTVGTQAKILSPRAPYDPPNADPSTTPNKEREIPRAATPRNRAAHEREVCSCPSQS